MFLSLRLARRPRQTRALTAAAASIVLLAALVPVATAAPAAQNSARSVAHLQRMGTTSFAHASAPAASGSTGTTNEFGPSLEVDQQIPHSGKVVHVAAAHVPTPAGNLVTSVSDAVGFAGLTHHDQRLANGGNQFSLEPPDQGLCVGNGYVLEAVNDALAVYVPDGSMQGQVTALNPFFGLQDAIVRSTKPVFGPFVSDPKCYFDTATQRWFVSVLEIDTNPVTGAFVSGGHVYIAVSETDDPTGKYVIYGLDTSTDGQGCSVSSNPCFGDQPLIGADANGFYVSTNSFNLAGTAFYGAQIYAFSKSALENGSYGPITGLHIDTGTIPTPDVGGIWYSLQPATSPDQGSFAPDTEYFLSALDFGSTVDNRIAVWALTDTSALDSASSTLSLAHVVIGSEAYGFPPDAQQKSGPIPFGAAVHSPEELLAGNDDRMNQVVYAAGHLWAALNSVVQTPNGPTRVGAAYFVVTPGWDGGTLSATMAQQGYVSVNQENVLFPSIGVTSSGRATMAFTLVGPDYYPSAAYATIGLADGAGPVHVAAAGTGPDDGFTGYRAFGGRGTGRWGDYSAAVGVGEDVWFATEYIPDSPRTLYANWGTWVGYVTP